MGEERDKIVGQIKKMFALAGNNPSKSEAETALTMAQELMAKHDLTQKDVNFDVPPEVADADVETDNGRNIPYWQKEIAKTVTKNLKCKHYYHREEGRWGIKIVGLDGDIEICLSAMKFAFLHFQNEWKKFMKFTLARDIYSTRSDTNGKKNDYIEGFITGLKRFLK